MDTIVRYSWKAAATVVLLAATLAGCASGRSGSASDTAAATSSASASSQPSASAGALPAEGDQQSYRFDLKSTGVEPLPKWAGKVEMTKKDPLYVSGTDLEGALTIDLKLTRKAGYLIANGEGVLWNGQRSVKFAITESAGLLEKKLSADGTLVFGALQAHSEEIKRDFSFDLRLVPEANELELRLPNRDGLIVFGKSAVLERHRDEVSQATSGA